MVLYMGKLGAQTAQFTADNLSGCAPLTVKLSDQSTGSPVKWLWDFDNGNTSTLQNPGVVFINPGTYEVELEIWDAANNSSKTTRTITVFKNPVANFTASPLEICVGESVSFSDASTKGDADISGITWDFGDGSSITQNNPSHTYNSHGKFRITQLVQDLNGCKAKKTVPAHITVNASPKVSFTADKTYDCKVPTTINFTASASLGKSPYAYSWKFGNGDNGSGATAKTTYTGNGKYTVELSVTDAKGCKGSSKIPNYIIVEPLKANFTASLPPVLCGPSLAEFTNTSTPSTIPFSSEWNFGDGVSSKKKNGIHHYKKEGTFDVELTVSHGACKTVGRTAVGGGVFRDVWDEDAADD